VRLRGGPADRTLALRTQCLAHGTSALPVVNHMILLHNAVTFGEAQGINPRYEVIPKCEMAHTRQRRASLSSRFFMLYGSKEN